MGAQPLLIVLLESGQRVTYYTWKRNIIALVKQKQYIHHCVLIQMSVKYEWYSQVVASSVGSRMPWLYFPKLQPNYARKCQTMLTLLCADHTLNANRGFYMFSTTKCVLCDRFEEEDVNHMLWRCYEFAILRQVGLEEIERHMPPAMWNTFTDLTDAEKSRFIITGMNCSFTAEWHEIYISILNLVCSIYMHRQRQIKLLHSRHTQ